LLTLSVSDLLLHGTLERKLRLILLNDMHTQKFGNTRCNHHRGRLFFLRAFIIRYRICQLVHSKGC